MPGVYGPTASYLSPTSSGWEPELCYARQLSFSYTCIPPKSGVWRPNTPFEYCLNILIDYFLLWKVARTSGNIPSCARALLASAWCCTTIIWRKEAFPTGLQLLSAVPKLMLAYVSMQVNFKVQVDVIDRL